jgi:hypothetical protein
MILNIINNSTVVSPSTLSSYVTAQQVQITSHFGPAWGVSPTVSVVSSYIGNPTIVLADNSDSPGALGYHTITDAGKPIGFAFVKTSQNYSYPWQTTASHEVLELLADQWVNSGNFTRLNSIYIWAALEVCDPVEVDMYKINSVWMSNFVFPTWFQYGLSPTPTRFDYMSKLHAPLTMTTGGYFVYQRALGSWLVKSARQRFNRLHTNSLSRLSRRLGGSIAKLDRD